MMIIDDTEIAIDRILSCHCVSVMPVSQTPSRIWKWLEYDDDVFFFLLSQYEFLLAYSFKSTNLMSTLQLFYDTQI